MTGSASVARLQWWCFGGLLAVVPLRGSPGLSFLLDVDGFVLRVAFFWVQDLCGGGRGRCAVISLAAPPGGAAAPCSLFATATSASLPLLRSRSGRRRTPFILFFS
jgi:hypothetical protein